MCCRLVSYLASPSFMVDRIKFHVKGLLNVAGAPSVAYDPSGSIFAVTLNLKSTTLLYDIRKLDVEPFAEISIADPVLAQGVWPLPRPPVYTSVKFSNDGNYLLVGTSAGIHYVLHSFNYNVVARLQGGICIIGGGLS